MEPIVVPLVVYAVVVGLLLAAGMTRPSRMPDVKLLLELQPTSRRIADAVDGQVVKIVGTVAPHRETLKSPLTARPCLYYMIVVVEQGRGGGELVREQRGVDFLMRDESGEALVHAGGRPPPAAALRLEKKREISTLLYRDEGLERFLTARGHSPKTSFSLGLRRHVRAYEAIIVTGQQLAASALAHWQPDVAGQGASYREAPERLTLAASGDVPLLLSDDKSTFGRAQWK
jgi:hypothetical protein